MCELVPNVYNKHAAAFRLPGMIVMDPPWKKIPLGGGGDWCGSSGVCGNGGGSGGGSSGGGVVADKEGRGCWEKTLETDN